MNMPIVLPDTPTYWRRMPDLYIHGIQTPAARVWTHGLEGLVVMRSLSLVTDGSTWIHVSVSRNDRIPSWPEIMKIKNEFIGIDREAYQVLPAKQDHVNIHSHCMHLWFPIGGARRVANLQDLQNEVAQ